MELAKEKGGARGGAVRNQGYLVSHAINMKFDEHEENGIADW